MFLTTYCGGLGMGGWLLMIAFWGALLAVAVWAVSRLFPSSGRRDEPADPLDRQLAAGELDPDTYQRLRKERADVVNGPATSR